MDKVPKERIVSVNSVQFFVTRDGLAMQFLVGLRMVGFRVNQFGTSYTNLR
jgi:hypothetical protein